MVPPSSQLLPTHPGTETSAAPRRVKYLNTLDQIPNISPEDREILRKVSERYVFRANDYYLRLINWRDPKDPIKQLIIPRKEELNDWGKLDASNESAVTVDSGIQHKYSDTALLLCNEVCGAYCRYCFRKRLFMNDNEEVSKDVSPGLAYIREHPEISNVLLTGGDPLIMGTKRLREIITSLRAIEHVKIIRIGSKMPAFNPFRILDDPELHELLREFSTPEKRIYIMCHFDHPREMTPEARRGIAKLIECGAICVNQCPLIRGINDDPAVLARMFREMSYIGCPQYYVFQGRPTAGNAPFEVPLTEAWSIFSRAIVSESGLAGRPRFCMSHASGKVEVLGVDAERIYLRYHRSKYPENNGKFFVCERDDRAYWLDHLVLAEGSFVPRGVTFGQARDADAAPACHGAQSTPATGPTPCATSTPVQVTLGGARCPSHAGFTLIELLVVISIIALLIGVLLPALSSARKTAAQTRETAMVHELALAHAAYSNDNRDALMPGYLRGSWARADRRRFIVADNPQDASETSRLFGGVIRPYSWRLMPYVQFSLESVIPDRQWRRTVAELPRDREDVNGYQYSVARNPGFGLNSTYVGGDAHRGGFFAPARLRWGNFYITRTDQAALTDKLIVFATSRGVRRNSNGEIVPGWHRVEAPWRATPTSNSVPAFIPWTAPAGPFDPGRSTTSYGHVDFRHFGKAVVGTIDGHAESLHTDQIRDMRRWSNQAGRADWRP